MEGIAGIAREGAGATVGRMLDQLGHRGPAGRALIECAGATLGVVWPRCQARPEQRLLNDHIAEDTRGPEHYAEARAGATGLTLERDRLGVVPLYYGRADDGALCFASEVKALQEATRDVHEMPPGHCLAHGKFEPRSHDVHYVEIDAPSAETAVHLRELLAQAVVSRLDGTVAGCWFSGGLDSSTIAALARPCVTELHTFAAGLEDVPDLAYAREGATFLRTTHHQIETTVAELLDIMPRVVVALESFDALLVRSSLTNYLVAQAAADYVPAVFSGEAGDNVLRTSLDNIGSIFHPAITILNAAWIEERHGDFEYYREGASPSVTQVLETMDKERIAVAAALGVGSTSARDWLYIAYGAAGPTLYEAMQANPGYQGIRAPNRLEHRYITEDVPMSLVPIAALGEHLNVPVPTIKAIIHLASVLHRRDYWAEGRTLDKLGLIGMSVQQIRHHVIAELV